MMQHMDNPTGWRLEVDESKYSMVWTPTVLINIWRLHPKVTATLEARSKEETVCKIVTMNSGLMDPFGVFKRFHAKTVTKLFSKIRQKTREYEQSPREPDRGE